MQKPVDLIIIDTKQEILHSLNNSGLPLSVSSMIINEIGNAISLQLNSSIGPLREQYGQALQAEQKENGKEEG